MKLYKFTFPRILKRFLGQIGYQERVLDFACSNAKFTSLIDCSYYLGIDRDERRIKLAKSRFPTPERTAFLELDILKDPIPDQENLICAFALTPYTT